MTRKDFEKIASTIKGLMVGDAEREIVAREFAVMLAATNDRFDKGRFLKACGVGR